MEREFIYRFMSAQRYAVLSSVSPEGHPQAALIGIAVNAGLDIIFDTDLDSRKCRNLLEQERVALVAGWSDEKTMQIEGKARLLDHRDDALKETYFNAFPEGRARSLRPGVVHFCIRPHWFRYSDFGGAEPVIKEFFC